jgi:hypothetical protein
VNEKGEWKLSFFVLSVFPIGVLRFVNHRPQGRLSASRKSVKPEDNKEFLERREADSLPYDQTKTPTQTQIFHGHSSLPIHIL